MFEGGTRVPGIVSWPKITDAGTRSDALVQSEDFYPTLLAGLGIDAQPDQVFDGVSFMAALRGEAFERNTVFQYFPHDPPVPDWIPPSVSVHHGNSKLIRIFFGGENGAHRYKLFDLSKDIGERNNLADAMPEQVEQLDQLITTFLDRTGAVVPLPNPKFDPAKYNPALEGVGRIRSGSKPKATPKRSPREAVAGWTPGGTCDLELQGSSIKITSTGGDPYLSFGLPKVLASRSYSLSFSMKSNSRGGGRLYWKEQGSGSAFSKDRSQAFTVTHDGDTHEYRVEWSTDSPVTAIRIDPSTGRGALLISDVVLSGSGKQVTLLKN